MTYRSKPYLIVQTNGQQFKGKGYRTMTTLPVHGHSPQVHMDVNIFDICTIIHTKSWYCDSIYKVHLKYNRDRYKWFNFDSQQMVNVHTTLKSWLNLAKIYMVISEVNKTCWQSWDQHVQSQQLYEHFWCRQFTRALTRVHPISSVISVFLTSNQFVQSFAKTWTTHEVQQAISCIVHVEKQRQAGV